MAGPLTSARSTLTKGAQKLRRMILPLSDYEQTIPPEIIDDEFYEVIRLLARTASISTALEIGSSTGEGSTRAFVEGLHDNSNRPTLFCLEVSRPRFKKLVARYSQDAQVRCYNLTSVSLDRFPTETEVIEFYSSHESKLNRIPLPEVLRWWRQDLHYLARLPASQPGIQMIKQENGVETFGMVLIDGSEFSGRPELADVYGADYILLDDIGTFKNFGNHERLSSDPNYALRTRNESLRNGYAVFERQNPPLQTRT